MERNARVVWLGEVGVTLYPKINVIGLCGSELNGAQVDHKFLKTNHLKIIMERNYNCVQFTHRSSFHIHYRK